MKTFVKVMKALSDTNRVKIINESVKVRRS